MRRAFSLMELLTVMVIITILAALVLPAVKSMTKGNNRSQSINTVKAMIQNARSIAISQNRMAGVVFFEETAANSGSMQTATAMQIFVEDYANQSPPPIVNFTYDPSTVVNFVYFSTARQYLPAGISIAALSDTGSGVAFAENADLSQQTRAILFDKHGDIVLRGGLSAPNPVGPAGQYPRAYADWKFGNSGVTNAYSYPGFFLFDKADYDAVSSTLTTDALRAGWFRNNSNAVIVNPNTSAIIE